MANIIECDRCNKQEKEDALPDNWKEIRITDNYASTGGLVKQLCKSCVESFWKWLATK